MQKVYEVHPPKNAVYLLKIGLNKIVKYFPQKVIRVTSTSITLMFASFIKVFGYRYQNCCEFYNFKIPPYSKVAGAHAASRVFGLFCPEGSFAGGSLILPVLFDLPHI